ncbi:hypothetical protein BpHYR1_051220 [Brachionus plicatilis]|uniref:Uncharacterized protein n=1 Tax=Brachionus plicatilis TaxID=10195 RepID=A0A3M7SXF2_BRAPC|nr:hypothetical protein BpHYR1_051220 [Brachionus plicatilis]
MNEGLEISFQSIPRMSEKLKKSPEEKKLFIISPTKNFIILNKKKNISMDSAYYLNFFEKNGSANGLNNFIKIKNAKRKKNLKKNCIFFTRPNISENLAYDLKHIKKKNKFSAFFRTHIFAHGIK